MRISVFSYQTPREESIIWPLYLLDAYIWKKDWLGVCDLDLIIKAIAGLKRPNWGQKMCLWAQNLQTDLWILNRYVWI